MEVFERNLRMVRGDSDSIAVTIKGDYTLQQGDFVELTVRKDPYSPIVLHKRITEFTDNTFTIGFSPEDTASLSFGDYVYDVQLTFGGAVKTIIPPSRLTIGEEVTYGTH